MTGSLTKSGDTLYRVAVFEPASGKRRWQAEHFEGKPGAFTHGEQVHHPVVLRDKIVAKAAEALRSVWPGADLLEEAEAEAAAQAEAAEGARLRGGLRHSGLAL